MNFIKSFVKDEQGQDLVEYTLLLAFIALAIGAVYSTMSSNVVSVWTKASTDLSNAATAAQ
ncbi:MAG TPA: Flp family type IVb pilin [Bryobacteraceae bacterium]|nr:Flp family type IVb pilin [Bryobacteraceae bacterium]